MERHESKAVLQGVRTLFSVGVAGALTDGELLDLFLLRRDATAEVAFTTLVDRHGPMVLRVCKSILRDPHDADDAFQAAFLVLARRASAIKKRGSVASWLFGVATRVSARARIQAMRQREQQRQGAAMTNHEAATDDPPELLPELREEVDRLPEKYRAPIVLCYLEGLTHEEAAGQLCVPVGTVKTRLTRARGRLRERLIRRGLVPSSGLLAGAGSLPNGATAAVPNRLAASTIRAALRFATDATATAGVPGSTASLAQGVLRAMFLSKLKSAGAIATGALALVLTAGLALPLIPRAVTPAHAAVPHTASPPDQPANGPDDRHRGPGTEPVSRSDLVITTVQSGRVEPIETVQVFARVTGYLETLEASPSDAVKQGQVLAVIDAPELRAEVEKSRAFVSQARARVAKAKAGLRGTMEARNDVKRAEEETVAAQQRVETLRKEHTQIRVAGKDDDSLSAVADRLEAARAAQRAAADRLELARASTAQQETKLESAQADVAEAEAALQAAQAEADRAAALWSHTRVRSPIDGVVTVRTCERGELVGAPPTGTARELFRIVRNDRVRVTVFVPDRDIARLDIGHPAAVALDAAPGGTAYEGKVTRIHFEENSNTSSLRTEIELANPEGRLRPGRLAQVTITLDRRLNVLTIPLSALVERGNDGSAACFRAVNDRAVRTRIKLGADDGQRVEILEGLEKGEIVITQPEQNLKDGQPIRSDQSK